ncbi:MAG: zinc-dependent alcohol dehydrogenase family protein [Bacteroidia bacterium]|nr:zinc-dependent alcohol dehydrogenase family protein [Bacteroidia bacterium]
MKAIYYTEFKGPIELKQVDDPVPDQNGVVVKVSASGLCRSDWHGWMGHDADITLPHVPGHELVGTIVEIGKDVHRFEIGDRITVPFVCGCGYCPQCATGNQQVCDHQSQPGFTHWGSFAEYVAIDYADTNLVRLPDTITDVTAASLGCRFITSYRAVVDQGQVLKDQWVAIHGCGGVGLSAIMIAKAYGAKVIGIDIHEESLQLAKKIGAHYTILSRKPEELVKEIHAISSGGVHLSIDALGSTQTCINSVRSLRKRGKHIQVGLMSGNHSQTNLPMDLVLARELEIIGSHGMQAHRYPEMLDLIEQGRLKPELLVERTISLEDIITELPAMGEFRNTGILVVDRF